MVKYLMLDHGGVLQGEFSCDPSKSDLILQNHDEQGYRILKNGVNIVISLYLLVQHFDYQLVFHSATKEIDQIFLLDQLHNACKNVKLNFPKITAMAIYDRDKYFTYTADKPLLAINKQYGITMAGYGITLVGKACVRQALSYVLNITEAQRSDYIVIDDDGDVIKKSKEEGYCAFHIGHGQHKISLDKALEKILQEQSEIKSLSKNSANLYGSYCPGLFKFTEQIDSQKEASIITDLFSQEMLNKFS